jgi:hypothetical protein
VILTDAAEIMPGSIEASRENVLTFNWWFILSSTSSKSL